MNDYQELQSHEFTRLWEHWLSAAQRREIGRAAWTTRPLDDERLEALASHHARRQVKFFVGQVAIAVLVLVPVVARLTGGHARTRVLDVGLLVVGSVLLIVAAAGAVTHRRSASLRGAAADWDGVKKLAHEQRSDR